MLSLKKELAEARRIGERDVEKAKQYGVTAFGKDMLEVVDVLKLAVRSFDRHLTATTTPTSAAASTEAAAAVAEAMETQQQQEQREPADPNVPPPSATHKESEKVLGALRAGVSMSLKVLEKHLKSHGIEPIPVRAGDPFDPHLHDAVTRVTPTEAIPADAVAEVLADGYTIRDRVLRAAQVTVAVPEQTAAEEEKPAQREASGGAGAATTTAEQQQESSNSSDSTEATK